MALNVLQNKLKSLAELKQIRDQLRKAGKKVVFTNGVFDLLHRGHVEYLEQARALGDVLLVGINSDASVKLVKGDWRPLVNQEDRAMVLAGLSAVDYICYFDEETPQTIISTLLPDVLVKGGDYTLDKIVGRDVVEAHGGQVVTIALTPGISTSELLKRMARLIKEGKISA